MTRDEAIDYINSHPDQFKGASQEEVLSKTQSSNDANYYNPTLYVPEQKRTVVKPMAPAPSKTGVVKTSVGPDVRQGLFTNVKLPALPITLALGLIALGAGMAIYRVSK